MRGRKGIVTDAKLSEPLVGVEITRLSASGEAEEVVYSDDRGQWQLGDIQDGQTVIIRKRGYVEKEYLGRPGSIVRLLNDQLIGYQERLWFRPGEEVAAYIYSPSGFSAKLCRHGFHKKTVLDFGEHEPCQQNVPDGYFVESGLDWRMSFSYKIPVDARPGLYSLLLEAEGEESFAVPFVLSTPPGDYGKKAKVLVLASTNTWLAYNVWGGRSRYRNFEDGNSPDFFSVSKSGLPSARKLIRRYSPDSIISALKKVRKALVKEAASGGYPQWMFRRLSIRRPFTNCGLEEEFAYKPFTNQHAGGEWRLLAWLEREDILYDIISCAELHKNPELLRNYNAIILSTHCEYWTREMYEGIKYFHQQGGLWIVNLSGNAMHRQIEIFEDGSIRCLSLFFHKSCADQTELIGVRFSMDGYATCAPFKIMIPDHWVFENVPIHKSSMIFGGLSLNQNTARKHARYDPGRPGLEDGLRGMGASGWETDKLSKTAPRDITVVAKGLNRRGGADMVVREPSGNRGGMFSASSVVFGGCLLIDSVASVIVKNVISRSLKKG